MHYDHTQRAPMGLLLILIATVILVVGWDTADEEGAWPILAGSAAAIAFAGMCFGSLTIRDEGERLAARYGPLPVFRTFVRYGDITSVEPGRSSFIDGWGMHSLPGRGSTYNLWGFSCVKLRVGKRTVRLGTDDVDGLVAFLREKTGEETPSTERPAGEA